MKKFLVTLMSFFIFSFICCFIIISYKTASNSSNSHEYDYYKDNSFYKDGTVMTAKKTDSNIYKTASISTASTSTASITETQLSENGEFINTIPEIDITPDSYTVLVNKEYSLPEDYVPNDLVVPDILFYMNYYDAKKLMRQDAATALEQLFQAAENAGLSLYAISGYRSYQRQEEIYNNNIETKGLEATNSVSAMPGHSEHQTGLAMDVSTSSIHNQLEEVFAGTPEGKWLVDNAHLYGYILRYPKNKSSITGYAYEPWHIRYVGIPLATYLHDNDLTLEEYYHYTSNNDLSNSDSFHSKDNNHVSDIEIEDTTDVIDTIDVIDSMQKPVEHKLSKK